MAGSPAVLQGQETIASERPGLAFSPVTVPRGSLQVEIGLPLFERAEEGPVETTTLRVPVVALRYGFSEQVELRAASPLYNRVETEDGTRARIASGRGDLELGAKWQVQEAVGSHPNVSVISSVVLPVGEASVSLPGERAAFALTGVAGWSVGSATAVTAVGGMSWIPAAGDAYAMNGTLVAWLGRTLTERVSAYGEIGWFPSETDVDPVLAGAGLAWLVTRDFQVDASFNRGLGDDAIDWIFGTGVCARF